MKNSDLPLVSLILPVKNEGVNIRTTIESALQVKTNFPFEIIVIDDGSTDGCCDFLASYKGDTTINCVRTIGIGLSLAKNLGAEQSNGLYMIFCDAHLYFEDFWIDRLITPMLEDKTDATAPGIAPTNAPDVVGYGQTLSASLGVAWNGPQPGLFPSAVLPGGCLAISRKVFDDIGGFDQGFRVWGFEDIEISIKLWLFGYRCHVEPNVKILHLFRASHPYQVTYEHVYYNMLRMAYSHFSEERIEKCRHLIQYYDKEKLDALVLSGDVLEQRNAYLSRRKKDDDWYMKEFGIPF